MASGASSGGAGDGDKSLRRRITAHIKKALNIKSKKSKRSPPVSDTLGTAEPSTPTTTAPIPPVPAVPAAAPGPAVVPATAPAAPQIDRGEREGPSSPPELPPREPQSAWTMARTPRVRHLAAPPVMTPAERALILFEKHGMEFGPVDWPLFQIPPTDRVPKEIRMRVHRTCHKCTVSFGADRVCTGCSHKRCKKCPKYPVKKSKDKSKGKEKAGEKAAEPPARKKKLHYDPNITIPSRHGGQPRVRKLARQRVHRLCHRCNTDFAGEKLCRSCGHTRCRTCPHDPYKKNKPPGYYEKLDPSDSEKEEALPIRPRRTFKKPRRRVHWVCGSCSTTFLERTKICEGCGSSREVTGIRDPPKRQPRRPADENTYRLQQRFRQVSLAATAAGRPFYLQFPRNFPP